MCDEVDDDDLACLAALEDYERSQAQVKPSEQPKYELRTQEPRRRGGGGMMPPSGMPPPPEVDPDEEEFYDGLPPEDEGPPHP
eukprot:CAMPEP_0117682196 /NCGR_PEP_ID=MMETSP0804-20121206/19486_1 /TAXON_ID=1074897 /ORGANISM="Tetraselmis astigmatica, Strain CCMP880" /LENGTH=82 /DNA_ID=CAMNT_0005492203 /DNA_START=55 /DNA_END=299 /DNA_ORIENTATION=+